MFLTKLLNTIGLFFTGMFHETKKAWAQISPELQSAMLTASSIINIFNQYLSGAPADILDNIKKDFPALEDPALKSIFNTISVDLGIGESLNNPDLLTTVLGIQKVLIDKKTADGTAWAKASHTGYLAISAYLAPPGTKFAALVAFAEYVYHDLIKGGK